jgi:putative ABC transport system substrate-binding protein
MNRRDLILLLGSALTVAPALQAQQKAIPVIGFLGLASPGPFAPFVAAFHRDWTKQAMSGIRPIESFRERLRELGWKEGQNIRFDYRSAEADDTRQPALAAELVALPVDLILSWGTPATLAGKHATATIPIVIGSIGDLVTVGVLPNLAHPGGNVTGFSSQSFELEENASSCCASWCPV